MQRPGFIEDIEQAFEVGPVVALLGPRQCGKTTLARAYVERSAPGLPRSNYLDLEDPTDLARLDDPKLALEGLRGLVVIDEVQMLPGLFPLLRTLVDRPGAPARFLIVGSASRDRLRQGSETLAGRITFVEVTPFAVSEVGGGLLASSGCAVASRVLSWPPRTGSVRLGGVASSRPSSSGTSPPLAFRFHPK